MEKKINVLPVLTASVLFLYLKSLNTLGKNLPNSLARPEIIICNVFTKILESMKEW